MKNTCCALPRSCRPGLTLLELTVVIMVLNTLVGVLFVGFRAYKAGADRAACVMNIYAVQKVVRSYANLNNLSPGQVLGEEIDLREELVGPGRYLEVPPECPGGGIYTDLGKRLPRAGEIYLSCSLAGKKRHRPQRLATW